MGCIFFLKHGDGDVYCELCTAYIQYLFQIEGIFFISIVGRMVGGAEVAKIIRQGGGANKSLGGYFI